MSTAHVSQLSSRPSPAQSLLLGFGFSALAVVGSTSGQLTPWTAAAGMTSATAPVPSSINDHLMILGPVVTGTAVSTQKRSLASLLADAHHASGLTWEQIARYFGVSRRAVHLWASGGRMTSTNEEALSRFVSAVEAVEYLAPGDRRQALLRKDSGLNFVDVERATRSSRPSDINRSPEIGRPEDRA